MEGSKPERPVFPRLPITPSAIHKGQLDVHTNSSCTIIVSAKLVTGLLLKTSMLPSCHEPKNTVCTTDTERLIMSQELTK